MSRARLVLTDSGGIQEEATVLGVPCLTLRETTERPVTITHGTNRVIGRGAHRDVLWDGHAAERIVCAKYSD